MNPLTEIIQKKIKSDGPIPLADYMALALGHPEHGYYMKRDPFGSKGDFITSPEISQIFGEMIGVWCAQLWKELGEGPVSLVELGPGRGTLMNDLLRATKKVPDFHESITIHMVETSPVLANAQYMALRDEHPRIEWLDSVDELPENRILLIANEFFDALPIKQFVMTEKGICERKVDCKDGEFSFTLASPGLQLAKSGKTIPKDAVLEQSPASRSIMRILSEKLYEYGGAALIIDYGYLGEPHQDTLQAVKNHAFHPVLKDPGEADMTAHVDFTSLMQIAADAGLAVHGTLNQGEWLTRMGATVRLNMLLKAADTAQAEQLKTGLDRITSPQAMGDLFKVLAVTNDFTLDMPGFAE